MRGLEVTAITVWMWDNWLFDVPDVPKLPARREVMLQVAAECAAPSVTV